MAAPRHLALPAYAGQAYIFGTLMAGAVWALSGGSVIGLSLLIYVSGCVWVCGGGEGILEGSPCCLACWVTTAALLLWHM